MSIFVNSICDIFCCDLHRNDELMSTFDKHARKKTSTTKM